MKTTYMYVGTWSGNKTTLSVLAQKQKIKARHKHAGYPFSKTRTHELNICRQCTYIV